MSRLCHLGLGPGFDCPLVSRGRCSATGGGHGGSGGRSQNQQLSANAYGSFKKPQHFGNSSYFFIAFLSDTSW